MKSYKTEAPAVSTVIRKPALLFTTFFCSGCITPAPGTWGSFAAWFAFWVMETFSDRSTIWLVSVLCFVMGIYAIPRCGKLLGKMDHGSIVIDEVVAVWLVLLLIPIGFLWQLAGVLAFRLFDIIKLPPVSTIDELEQSGFTVMIDDIFAAIYALIVVNGLALVFEYCFGLDLVWKVF